MTLHVYEDLEQGSEEWLEARRGIITASIVGQLITPSTLKPANNPISRSIVAQLAAERITGWSDPTFVTADMERGNFDEPLALDVYAEHFAPIERVGFMVEDRWGFKIGYSPDALVGDDGLVEVKSRRPKKHLQTIMADEVPAENMAQLQCGLLVSGRKWVDYVSFCGGMHLWRKRVEPDREWQDAIVAAATKFESTVGLMQATYEARTLGLPMTERIDFGDVELTL